VFKAHYKCPDIIIIILQLNCEFHLGENFILGEQGAHPRLSLLGELPAHPAG